MKSTKIGVVGLGYVGLTFAISLAKRGFKVNGYENNLNTFKLLSSGKAQFYEENIDKDLKKILKNKKLKIFKNLDNIKDCNLVFITVGTPIGENKKVNLDQLFKLVKLLKNKLSNNTIVALRSTVKLGTTDKIEKILNDKNKIYLAMCPERTAEGSALKEIHFLPQIIGTKNSFTKNKLKKLFLKITKTTIIFNSFEEAEILKLIDNSYRDTIFGFANELASISEHYKINILNVINKIGIGYPRSKVAFPGTVGGPCLTKDSHLLIESVKKKVNLNIVKSARKINEETPLKIIKLINKKIKTPIKRILFCGLAFKGLPETSDTRGSMAKSIIQNSIIKFKKPKIYCLDNYVSKKDALKINNNIIFFDNFKKINNSFDIIFFLNNNPYWKKISLEKFKKKLNSDGLIFDFWSSFNEKNIKKKYFKLGEGKLFDKKNKK